jgi:simple sugar transport system permease protein
MKNNRSLMLQEVCKYFVAFALSIGIGSIIIVLQGGDALASFTAILYGSLGGSSAITKSIRWITPCIISGIAATVAFKSGVNNLGTEGQIYVGAFVAAVAGYSFELPHIPHVIVILALASLGGMIYALVPALLRLFLNVNEMITTLMLNYIAVLATDVLTRQLMHFDGSTSPDQVATPPILPTARLTQLVPPYQATTGIFIAIGLALLIFFTYKYTVKGYELKQVGENISFARQGGVRVIAVYLMTFLLSGMIAGLCGAVEILGPHGRFRSSFANNLGWDGIMVSLIAKNDPIAVIFVGAIWGLIKSGTLAMERVTDTSRVIISLIQALFVLFVTVDYSAIQTKLSRLKAITSKE